MSRISVSPELLSWACERSGRGMHVLTERFSKLEEWIAGDALPTLKQLENFAKATRTPIGYLFLQKPPEERIPIPDFRTVANNRVERASVDLLETLYICQQRQVWYQDFARSVHEDARSFVGSVQVGDDVVKTASAIRKGLGFDIASRCLKPTWEDAMREFIAQADESGILVMVSGVAGNNNRRTLNPQEFRGFALADSHAPLVFINGADTKSAQMFTLAHELVHIWLGKSALSDAGAYAIPDHRIERWCNEVAAEILVPMNSLRIEHRPDNLLETEMRRLSKVYKVSTLVVLRRMHDLGALTREEFRGTYDMEVKKLMSIVRGPGGAYYNTQSSRLSKRFARAIFESTLEGRSSFTEAFRLLGVKKMSTFKEFGNRLGVNV